jgi:SAM-dependent MidA family methyltransferase
MEILTNSQALHHCQLLSNLIDKEIKNNAGWLPFSQFMDLALYAPELGYYTSGSLKFGSQGDFITAPEISPFFGATLGKTVEPVLAYFAQKKEISSILEFGAGSGKLCQDILLYLKDAGQLPDQYLILEVSPDLIDRQKNRLQGFLSEHQISTQIRWLDHMPDDFKGVVLANEVLDAIPFDLIIWQQGKWHYHVVVSNPDASSPSFSDHWHWQLGTEVPESELPIYLTQSGTSYPENYVSEIHPRSHAWLSMISQALIEGVMIAIDYGFPEHEYYHPQRTQGTHIAHHRHQAIPDMFYLPGLCDITAHVDWTSLNRIAQRSGMHLASYQSQGAYLLHAGIGDLLMANMNPSDPIGYATQAQGFQKLISEAEMGELFKIIAWSKSTSTDDEFVGLCASLPGFTNRQRLLEV